MQDVVQVVDDHESDLSVVQVRNGERGMRQCAKHEEHHQVINSHQRGLCYNLGIGLHPAGICLEGLS